MKSRLNYARKAIKAGVEELERTQNFKFYGLMPAALMAFMLRREAEAFTLAPEQSARMISAVLAAAQARMTAAAVAAMRDRTRPELDAGELADQLER